MSRFAAALLMVVLLAGCASKDGSEVADVPSGPSGAGDAAEGSHQLHGWILDGNFVPIEGATVSIHGHEVTATSRASGYFGFNGLDTDLLLTLQAEAENFKPQTRALTLQPDANARVNFTLLPVPVNKAYRETITMKGHIGCSAVMRTQDSRQPYDCSVVSPVDNRIWEFTVQDNVASIVVEAFWAYKTQLAEHLNLTVETVNLGIFDEILATTEGASPIQGIVTKEQSNRFYRQGGTVRAIIDVGRNIDEDESNAGAGVAIDEEVDLFATIFYVAPAPPGYTHAA